MFWIELPKTVKEVIIIDKRNGDAYWQDVIANKKENEKVAFHILSDSEKASNSIHFVNWHIVFDIKMEDFRREACLVVGGHMT